MITRRNLFVGLPLGFTLASLTRAQPRSVTIGWLTPFLSEDNAQGGKQFDAAMLKLGYVKEKHYSVVLRSAEGKNERLPALAEDPVRLKVDLIVAAPTDAVIAVQRATAAIPIVFFSVGDPVRSGFADSLAHPGRNLTGLSNFAGDLNAKRFELMKQMLPGLTRVAILANPTSSFYPGITSRWPLLAEQLGLRSLLVDAKTREDLGPAFKAMSELRAEAAIVVGDAFLWNERQLIADLALRGHLPTMFTFVEHVEAGGLMSYAADTADVMRRVATYVDRIIRGVRPGDIPIEQANKIDLVINGKTANALHLIIPPVLLLQAERVIE